MTSIPYQLIRSAKRRTIGLQIKASKVRVLAPSYVPQSEIDLLVQQKSAWINKKIALQQTVKVKSERRFVDGDILYYLGQPYILKVKLDEFSSVEVVGNHLVVSVNTHESLAFNAEPLAINKESLTVNKDPVIVDNEATTLLDKDTPTVINSAYVKALIEQWYNQHATELLRKQVTSLQNHTGLYGSSLTIKHYKTRWGSCDNKKRIKLNWLLIMAPIEMIDYVIIHELCHLQHLNHSNQFWQLVNRYYADVSQAKLWFKQHQEYLYW